jgi:hypothetical protein
MSHIAVTYADALMEEPWAVGDALRPKAFQRDRRGIALVAWGNFEASPADRAEIAAELISDEI